MNKALDSCPVVIVYLCCLTVVLRGLAVCPKLNLSQLLQGMMYRQPNDSVGEFLVLFYGTVILK